MAIRTNPVHHDNIIRHYLCANCWGDLYERNTGEKTKTGAHIFEIACSTPDCPCHGFVSKNHVETMETLARIDRKIIYWALRDILPWMRQLGPTPDVGYPWDPETEKYITPERVMKREFEIAGLDF